jgi:hypothetical protein
VLIDCIKLNEALSFNIDYLREREKNNYFNVQVYYFCYFKLKLYFFFFYYFVS